MKTIVVFFLLATAASLSASEQETSSLNYAGLKAGPSLSSFWGNEIEDARPEFAAGFSAGAVLSFEIASWFAIQPEILFTRKGALMSPEDNKLYRVHYQLDYIELPLLFSFVTPSKGVLKGNIYFGGYGAALLQTQVTTRYNGATTVNPRDVEPDDGWMPVDAGAAIGGGVKFNLDNIMEFSVDLRYSMGFVPLGKDGRDMVGNRSFSVSAGVSF